MASAKRDYEEFVRWLYLPAHEVPSNVRRMANLVLANFDAIQGASRQRSKRSALIADLSQRNLLRTSDTLPEIAPAAVDGTWQWKQLSHITVGPFRGFRHPEPFDLHKRIVLFYGPNGSGKTSFCEALEYALLGSVEEADAKRIPAATYLSNIHERRFESPVLRAIDHHGNEVNVVANADTYRFCFIEKNRIDSFSRIAARPAAQRTELIATLFGMDKFNEFVGHFNETVDAQLALTTDKQTLLKQRRAALEQDQAIVVAEAASLQALDNEELEVAREYDKSLTYQGLKELIGSDENPSRLQQLNQILNAVPSVILDVTRKELQKLYENADTAQDKLEEIAANLQQRANQVSFKELYTAVSALQPTESTHCPACDTPLEGLNHVIRNPYEKAAEGLDELRELAGIQINHEQAVEEVARISRLLLQKLKTILEFIISNNEQDGVVGCYLAALPDAASGSWWKNIYETNGNGDQEGDRLTLKNIFDVAQRIEEQDVASRLAIEVRQKNIDERDRLNRYQLRVQAQDSKRQNFLIKVASARKEIETFEEANANLIQEAAQELVNNKRDIHIKEAYDRFLVLLRRYRNKLPGTLMAGLNNRAMMLYNDFNRNDFDDDKLANLHLPLTGDQKIEISYRGNPQGKVDALRILSEGHVRCLGLAILLAKSMSLNSPLIVFDDAINAIDHDHRGGIRDTIFQSDYFSESQIIVTCHSHEFIKDIQQCLPQDVRRDSKVYLFRNHSGNYHPKVNRDIASRNYVEMARAAREELNDRGSLDASRKAIEMLMEKIWRWLGSHDHGTITVPLAGVGAEPALRNLCEALLKKINKTENFVHDNKPKIVTALQILTGIPSENLVWKYLNKGTHEEGERDDFDSEIVESVVGILEELEALDFRPGR